MRGWIPASECGDAVPRVGLWLLALVPPLLLVGRGTVMFAWLAAQQGLAACVAAWSALAAPVAAVWLLRSGRADRVHRRLADPFARAGLVVILVLHLMALMAPLLSTHDPAAQDPVGSRFQPPSVRHWMGTDALGRDLYTRVVHGARVSLAIGLASVLCNVVLGLLIGGAAGYLGGWVDGVLMRFTDLLLAFPRVFLVLALVAVVTPSWIWIVAVLGATGWMGVARLVRGGVLAAREMAHVEAARALGVSDRRILLRHVLPIACAPLIAAATLRIGNTILVESFLSFLGLGVQDPTVSWGMLIRAGRTTLLSAWWVSTFPGLAILLTVIGYNLLGDGLRDAYDPRLRQARAPRLRPNAALSPEGER